MSFQLRRDDSRSPASGRTSCGTSGRRATPGATIEAWIQAPSPIASAVSNRFCSSRSASICVRIDQMVPSGSLISLLRKPFSTHFFTPAGR